MNLVVDQDLARGEEFARGDHGAIAKRAPVGVVGELCERDRIAAGGGVELRAQRLLRMKPSALPVARTHRQGDHKDRGERRQCARPIRATRGRRFAFERRWRVARIA
jgi:hypothetical protein